MQGHFLVVEPPITFEGKTLGESAMNWTTPTIIEICVGMEINCYACAEI